MNLEVLSHTVGWLYVLFWGTCNYPTLISNIQLKSVQGISIDYLFFNGVGFSVYTLYTSAMYFSPLVREEFKLQVGEYPLIKINDVFFGTHNLLINLFILSQAYIWGYRKNDNQYLSRTSVTILSAVFAYIVLGSLFIYRREGFEPVDSGFNWVHLFTSLGLIKIVMSVCKNIPQVVYNYKRKSTHGWPILMVWLDFFGGFFSFVQLIIDAYAVGNINAMFNNLPKLLLAIEVFLADAIFFYQHYCLYYNADIEKYGTIPSSYNAIAEDEEYIIEHSSDHNHRSVSVCTHPMDTVDKDEMQRLIT